MPTRKGQQFNITSTLGRVAVAVVFAGTTACSGPPEPVSTTVGSSDASTTSAGPTTSTLLDRVTTNTAESAIEYQEYVETALEIMERFFYATDHVDWYEIRQPALEGLATDPSPEQAYAAIRDALQELGDPHSRFEPPQIRRERARLPGEISRPSGERMSRIGYLKLPGVGLAGTIDPDDPKAYANQVNALLEELDSPEPACGWIVDLRENAEGWISPMFASLGPLLGQGIVLTANGPQGTQTIEVDKDYLVSYDFEPSVDAPSADFPLLEEFRLVDSTREETLDFIDATITPSGPVYEPELEDPPVAVLISGTTGSAAEYVTIAFLGRDNTQTFGETTRGVPTARGGYQFVDGGVLGLAVLAPADRLGRTHSSHIFADEFIGPSPPGEDRTLDSALEWLTAQPSCE